MHARAPCGRATRAQADRALYKQAIRATLENTPNLSLFQQSVSDLIVEGEHVNGVVTEIGLRFSAPCVVLTVGTFLGGKIHIGLSSYAGGRAGDPPSNALAARLRELPFRVERLKTGTPPRIDGRTIDYGKLATQPGDEPVPVFSFLGHADEHPEQVACYITRTTERTHDIIRGGLDRSPMYSGKIEGVGPRYCPSIEDKIVRFAERDSHQIFVEPEGLSTHEVYPNGISTSLPFDVQYDFVQSITGFENAHITRPGYAIEYDFFDPRDLKYSLETNFIQGLFFAGQINGTTGYEEAAAQGLLAGLNAARKAQEKNAWYPRRDEAYLGVLVDDLISRGTLEPYRMFTSRAEYRLLLREDNADLRLTPTGRELGLVDDERWSRFEAKREAIEREQQRLKAITIQPASEIAQAVKDSLQVVLSRDARAHDLLRRPEVGIRELTAIEAIGTRVTDPRVLEQIEIQAKYAGYLDRQETEIDRQRRYEDRTLPGDMDYAKVRGLSAEVQEKLSRQQPETVGQAARIPGVTPAAISLLLVHFKKSGARRRKSA